jgi:hypothetical protein
MTCARCGGVMAPEEFSNMTEGAVPWFYAGWRCLYCGDIVDPLILRHRWEAAEPSERRMMRAQRRAA